MLKLGYILTEQGLLTEDQLKTALELQKMTGKKLGEVLIDKGMLSDIQIMKALEIQCKIPYVDLSDVRAEPGALSLIGEEYARKFCAIPIDFEDDKLIVAINDPLDFILVDEIGYLTGKNILPRLSTKKQILAAIETNYGLSAGQLTVHKAEHDLEKKARKPKIAVDHKPEPVAQAVFVAPIPVTAPAPVQTPAPVETPAPTSIVNIPEPTPISVEVENIPEPVAVQPEIVAPPAPEPNPETVEVYQTVDEVAAEQSLATITEDRLPDQGGFMLDFTKSVKQHFPVNMIDNQTIRVRMPTKKSFAAMVELQDKLARLVTLNANISAQLDEIYDLCSTILSNNLDQKEISSEYLSDLLDLEDLRIFYKTYAEFVNSVLNGTNN